MLIQEQIGVTKDDLEAHVQKNTHVQKMQELKENGAAPENQRKYVADMVSHKIALDFRLAKNKCDPFQEIRNESAAVGEANNSKPNQCECSYFSCGNRIF